MNKSVTNYTLHVSDYTNEERAPGIALVAHDKCKATMIEWTRTHKGVLAQFTLYATGTTGTLINRDAGLRVRRLLSGHYGGDAQIGALLAERRVRCCIFFWDPLTPQPHEPDVKALLRLAVLHNIPIACNRATADLLITSPLFVESLNGYDFADDESPTDTTTTIDSPPLQEALAATSSCKPLP